MPQHQKSKSGFTLLELLIAITVIAIVGTVIISSVAAVQRKARDSQRMTDLKKIQLALQQYYADHGFYPNVIAMEYVDEIDDCIDPTQGHQAAGCVPTRVYLHPIPKEYYQVIQEQNFTQTGNNCARHNDPASGCPAPYYTGSSDIHYCYHAQVSSTNGARCDNTNPATRCQYYRLYARLEASSIAYAPICDPNQDLIPGVPADYLHYDNYYVASDGGTGP